MTPSRSPWCLAGLVAGGTGIAASYVTATILNLRLSPVSAVAELVIRLTPGAVVEAAISVFGASDKIVLGAAILVILALAFAGLGALGRRRWFHPVLGFAALGVVGAIAMLTAEGASATDVVPVVVGFVVMMMLFSALAERLRRMEELREVEGDSAAERAAASRRGFLTITGVAAGLAAGGGVIGRVAGGARRRVDQARRLLRLTGVTAPVVPDAVSVGVDGVGPWMTPAVDFYLIDTAFIKPAIEPSDWQLRIHGMVEQEIVLDYDDLVARDFIEAWVTLNCVSNEVGGTLVGNAWWSGVPLAPLLEEAGVSPDADAVLQTSEDGWTCGTPLEALTDGRDAMLAVAMNGRPLRVEHGFPVRTLVPGLYGYVSGTKWVIDMEVTRFADIEAYWTQRGWGEKGPVKMASRIEVPRPGTDVAAGTVVLAGTAWLQGTGISGVEVSLDGGGWTAATIAEAPSDYTWVQWRAEADLDAGTHRVRVRAIDAEGETQTGVRRDVLPDGATGWDEIEFTCT